VYPCAISGSHALDVASQQSLMAASMSSTFMAGSTAVLPVPVAALPALTLTSVALFGFCFCVSFFVILLQLRHTMAIKINMQTTMPTHSPHFVPVESLFRVDTG
jgi:hypothetical protein